MNPDKGTFSPGAQGTVGGFWAEQQQALPPFQQDHIVAIPKTNCRGAVQQVMRCGPIWWQWSGDFRVSRIAWLGCKRKRGIEADYKVLRLRTNKQNCHVLTSYSLSRIKLSFYLWHEFLMLKPNQEP
jgi:hypothetical protein